MVVSTWFVCAESISAVCQVIWVTVLSVHIVHLLYSTPTVNGVIASRLWCCLYVPLDVLTSDYLNWRVLKSISHSVNGRRHQNIMAPEKICWHHGSWCHDVLHLSASTITWFPDRFTVFCELFYQAKWQNNSWNADKLLWKPGSQGFYKIYLYVGLSKVYTIQITYYETVTLWHSAYDRNGFSTSKSFRNNNLSTIYLNYSQFTVLVINYSNCSISDKTVSHMTRHTAEMDSVHKNHIETTHYV